MPFVEDAGRQPQNGTDAQASDSLGRLHPADDGRRVVLPEVPEGDVHRAIFAEPRSVRTAPHVPAPPSILAAWISTSSSSARPDRCRPRSAARPRSSSGVAASGCSSTAARARSGSCCSSAVGLVDLREVFLTHYHADHYLGLPGMLKTFACADARSRSRSTARPASARSSRDLRRIFGKLTYEYTLVELRPGDRLPRDGYALDVFPVLHGRNAVGYTLLEDERPGRFDVSTADRARRPRRPGARRAPARRAGHARRRPNRHA